MPAEDYFYDIDPDAYGVTCRRCGAQDLHWDVQKWDARGFEVWRLYDDDDQLHECSNAASADEFEDVS